MEESENQIQNNIGFPQNGDNLSSLGGKKKEGGKWLPIALFLLGLVILGGAIFYVGKDRLVKQVPSPSPESKDIVFFGESEETETPSPSPAISEIDKEDVEIEIQNGTGITGEAGFLKNLFEKEGYKNIKTGNASSYDYIATEVTFSSSLPDSIVEEITKVLKDTYQNVKDKTSTSLKGNKVLIITGLRKGVTPRPSPSPSPSASPSVSPSASPSASPSL